MSNIEIVFQKPWFLLLAIPAFAVILLALIVPATAFYTMWIMGVGLFALAVYYTTKLM